MHLFGFYLAAYINWWGDKIRAHPGRWLKIIALAQFPILYIVAKVFQAFGPMTGAVVYFGVILVLGPAGIAAHIEQNRRP